MSRVTLELSPTAVKNINDAHEWIKKRSKPGARLWYRALLAALNQIRLNPKQYPIAEESVTLHFELRQSIFSTPAGQPYRLLFSIEHGRVRIHHLRCPGQDVVEPGPGQ